MSIHIPNITVVQFIKSFDTGGNRPWLADCIDENRERDQYVVKFHGVIAESIIREYAANYLAALLGIKAAPMAFVYVPAALQARLRPELKEPLAKLPQPHIGSRYLKGYTEFTIDHFLPDDMIESMILYRT